MSELWVTFAALTITWSIFLLYSVSVLFWVAEVGPLSWNQLVDSDELVYDLKDVQIRILTVGAEAVVQGTVNAVPDEVADICVIAEREIHIDGADVHVVPTEFECHAHHKGRALE